LGQKQTSHHFRVMSIIPLKADIRRRIEHVCFVPKATLALGSQEYRDYTRSIAPPPPLRVVLPTPIC
jgi:hypothetical protein